MPPANGANGSKFDRESLSRALVDVSADCVIAIDTDGRVVEWNPAAERTFGYSREEALGGDLARMVIPPSQRRGERQALLELAASPPAPRTEMRHERTAMTSSGEKFPIELTIAHVPGPPALAVGFVRDVSDRHKIRLQREAEERRRQTRVALGHQVLRHAPLDEFGIAVALAIREELEVDVVRIWQPPDDGRPLALVASAGPADEIRHGPPPMPSAEAGPLELPDGLVFRVTTPEGPAAAISLHSEVPHEFSEEDLSFVESLSQMLVATISHHSTVEQLEMAERRYRGLIERLPIVSYMAEYGPEGRWYYVSPQIEQLLGFTSDEWLTDNDLWWRCVHPDDRERIKAEEENCVETLDPLSIEYRMVARDGHVIWVRDEGAYGRPGERGQVLVEGVLLDITERRHAEEELRHQADHDELTGLANRRRFTDELARRRASERPHGAVAILDVDDLKYVNDSLGHAAGDALLRSVGSSLGEVLRPGEFLARFGGDEFTVILDVSTDAGVRRRLAALLRSVRGRQSRITARASAGAVIFNDDAPSTDEDLIVAADIALHEAKERGGDRYQIFTGAGSERLAWVGHLRSAIDNDRLTLYEQPIFDLATGEAAGSEMLVRIIEADGSVLAPAAFLPTAERFGLIREIDRWVIDKAIDVAAAGRPVTINVSARSISDPGLSGHIRYALERSGADPSNIVFELTETAAATASEDLREFGSRIEQIGCALAIDDFGTGFGSLTYLKHLPVRYLKIDMEFVRGIAESAADRAIVQSIVTIAGSLGMRTIAEGVEDQATLDALRGLGVDFAQGYHLGRPAPLARD
ncbi:MAG TPA: EAL domain-containing protein [Solirubrobacterales bacterium]|jgi:diguanylate cyclase (GGDEF)-like protein/PAS domain S-box-containing protein